MRRVLWGLLIVIVLVGGWYIWGHVAISNRLVWISCSPSWQWKINSAKLSEYRKVGGARRGVVYLSCRYKKATEGAGLVGYPEMLMYAEQKSVGGVSVITLYPHKALRDIKREERAYLVTRLVVWELAMAGGTSRSDGERLGAKVAQGGGEIIELVPWRIRE